MDTQLDAMKIVTLPNNEEVEVSMVPQDWWTKHGASGYIDPELLLHDPKQPRRFIDPDAKAGLAESISEVGVRESLVITPTSHVPWRKLSKDEKKKPFLIVSGHRRQNASVEVGIGAVPFVIRIYPNKKEHEEDLFLLNHQREGFTELEEGYVFAQMIEQEGNINRVAKKTGNNHPYVQRRVALTKLDPELQRLLDTNLKPANRLSSSVGASLGNIAEPSTEEFMKLVDEEDLPENLEDLSGDERRFSLQKFFLKKIKRHQMGAVRAVDFIQGKVSELPSHSLNGGRGGRSPERFEPRKRLAVLENLFHTINDSIVFEWKPEEFRRILVNIDYKDLFDLISIVSTSKENLAVIESRLNTILKTKHVGCVDTDMVRVTYYKNGFLERDKFVSFNKYVELWENNLLEFQKNKHPKPDDYPTLEEAQEKAKLF